MLSSFSPRKLVSKYEMFSRNVKLNYIINILAGMVVSKYEEISVAYSEIMQRVIALGLLYNVVRYGIHKRIWE